MWVLPGRVQNRNAVLERPLWLRGCEFLRQRALLRASDFCRNCSRFGGAKASTCWGFEAMMANSPPLFSGKKIGRMETVFHSRRERGKNKQYSYHFYWCIQRMSNEILKIKYPKRSSYLKNIILYIRTVMGTKKVTRKTNPVCVALRGHRDVWSGI